jgi:hypothetical protein
MHTRFAQPALALCWNKVLPTYGTPGWLFRASRMGLCMPVRGSSRALRCSRTFRVWTDAGRVASRWSQTAMWEMGLLKSFGLVGARDQQRKLDVRPASADFARQFAVAKPVAGAHLREDDGRLTFQITIPGNTTATVYLPAIPWDVSAWRGRSQSWAGPQTIFV